MNKDEHLKKLYELDTANQQQKQLIDNYEKKILRYAQRLRDLVDYYEVEVKKDYYRGIMIGLAFGIFISWMIL